MNQQPKKAREYQNLVDARNRPSQAAQQDKKHKAIDHMLKPINNALNRIKEVVRDIQELVDAAIGHAESDETKKHGN